MSSTHQNPCNHRRRILTPLWQQWQKSSPKSGAHANTYFMASKNFQLGEGRPLIFWNIRIWWLGFAECYLVRDDDKLIANLDIIGRWKLRMERCTRGRFMLGLTWWYGAGSNFLIPILLAEEVLLNWKCVPTVILVSSGQTHAKLDLRSSGENALSARGWTMMIISPTVVTVALYLTPTDEKCIAVARASVPCRQQKDESLDSAVFEWTDRTFSFSQPNWQILCQEEFSRSPLLKNKLQKQSTEKGQRFNEWYREENLGGAVQVLMPRGARTVGSMQVQSCAIVAARPACEMNHL